MLLYSSLLFMRKGHSGTPNLPQKRGFPGGDEHLQLLGEDSVLSSTKNQPQNHPPTNQPGETNYFASSNPHPPHSRAYDRYNKFLCILETSTPNSHRPLPFPSATSTCLRADLKNSNIGSVNKSQAPSKKKPDGGLYKRSCLFTTQSNTTASPFPSLRVHSKHEGTNMKCKPNCASGGTLSKTRLASCSSGILAGSTGEYWRAAPARYWPDTLQDPPARVGSTGELRWDTQRDTWRDPLAGGMLGGIHWRAALAGYSAGSTGEWIHLPAALAGYSAGSTGGILVHCRTPLAGYWTGSTGGIVWRDTGPLPDSSGGILDGIHWQNCLAGYWAGSTGRLLWQDTGRDPLAELFGGMLGGPLANSSGGILGGIHWRTTLAGYWAGSTGGPLWRDTGRDALGGRTTLAGCWAGFTGGLL